MKIKYVEKEKISPATGFVVYKTETIYIDKTLPKIIQKFILEHEKFHLKDYKRLKGKKESLFWCELKAYVYAFFKQPLAGLLAIIRNLYPPKFISFVKLYFWNNRKKTDKIARKLTKLK